MIVGYLGQIWRYPVKSMAGERLEHCLVGLAGVLADRGWALRDDDAGEIRGAKAWPVLMQCSGRYREPPTENKFPAVDIALPDGTCLGSDEPKVSARLSELVGRPVSLSPLQPASHKAHYRRAQPGAAMLGWLSRSRLMRRLLQKLIHYTKREAELRAEFGREPDEPLPDLSVFPPELFEFTSPPGTYFDAFPIHLLTTSSLDAMARLNPKSAWDVRRFRPNFLIETGSGTKGLVENNWSGRTLRLGNLMLKCAIPTARCSMTTHVQAELPKDPLVLRTIVREAEQNLGIYATVISAGSVTVGDAVELLEASRS
jgi:uncharacterized protein YcbX